MHVLVSQQPPRLGRHHVGAHIDAWPAAIVLEVPVFKSQIDSGGGTHLLHDRPVLQKMQVRKLGYGGIETAL